MADKSKRVITRSKYLQALGLFTLANRKAQESKAAELEMIALLELDDDTYAGCISDAIYDERPNFDKALAAEGIVVRGK